MLNVFVVALVIVVADVYYVILLQLVLLFSLRADVARRCVVVLTGIVVLCVFHCM